MVSFAHEAPLRFTIWTRCFFCMFVCLFSNIVTHSLLCYDLVSSFVSIRSCELNLEYHIKHLWIKHRSHPIRSRDKSIHFLGNCMARSFSSLIKEACDSFFLNNKWLRHQSVQMKQLQTLSCYLAIEYLMFGNTIIWDSSGR